MKRKVLSGIAIVFLIFGITGVSQATLETIGKATYNGSDYNLIWDDDNNGNSVVWLDYSASKGLWSKQTAWAAGLDADLTVNLSAGYSVSWDDSAWRLPATVDGIPVFGWDGTTTYGFNITNSEMGHLYYEELGNLGYISTDGTSPQIGWGLNNTGDFDNLIADWYWSGTEYADDTDLAWFFSMDYARQNYYGTKNNWDQYALAVRNGQVSAVPIPSTIGLLGLGILGLAGVSRHKQA